MRFQYPFIFSVKGMTKIAPYLKIKQQIFIHLSTLDYRNYLVRSNQITTSQMIDGILTSSKSQISLRISFIFEIIKHFIKRIIHFSLGFSSKNHFSLLVMSLHNVIDNLKRILRVPLPYNLNEVREEQNVYSVMLSMKNSFNVLHQ